MEASRMCRESELWSRWSRGWEERAARRRGGALGLRLGKTLDAAGRYCALFALRNKNTFYRFCFFARRPRGCVPEQHCWALQSSAQALRLLAASRHPVYLLTKNYLFCPRGKMLFMLFLFLLLQEDILSDR